MVQENSAIPPAVIWAQRSDIIFLTFCLEDCRSPEIKIEPNRVYFKGTGGTDKKLHEVEINLFRDIEPEESVHVVRDRVIELTLKKRDECELFWPQLTKEKAKYHWLKVDFNKWEDNDSTDEDDEGRMGTGNNYNDLSEMVKRMGGLGGGDSKGAPSLDDLESDSDDEEGFMGETLPPLE